MAGDTSNDYFPFGLAFNSYSRENSVPNQYLYVGKEKQDELDLGWLDFGWRMYDPTISRWVAIDQKADKYRTMSPYNSVMNNPLRFYDPDGREVFFDGQDAKKAAKHLDKSSSLKIKYDKRTGQVSAKGKAKTEYDKKLLEAINDKGVRVNVHTTRSNSLNVGGAPGDLVVGAFGGNKSTNETYKTFNPDNDLDKQIETHNVIQSDQYVNLGHARAEQEVGGLSIGKNVGHETLESYIAAKASPNASANDEKAYQFAHYAANALGTNDPNVTYSFDKDTRSWVVKKPGTVNVGGLQIPVTNTRVLYQKP